MEIKIVWPELSAIQLKGIFDYYCIEAGEGTAKKNHQKNYK